LKGEVVAVQPDATRDTADLKGRVALFARGKISFTAMLQIAQARKASGMIVYSHDDIPVKMNLPAHNSLPAVMITSKTGQAILKKLQSGPVRVVFGFGEPNRFNLGVSKFSSAGPSLTPGVFKPDVLAPGERYFYPDKDKPGSFIAAGGTSFAAPYATKAVALLKSMRPEVKTLDEVRALLTGTAFEDVSVPVTDWPASVTRGAGVIDVERMLKAKLFTKPASMHITKNGGGTGLDLPSLKVCPIGGKPVPLSIAGEGYLAGKIISPAQKRLADGCVAIVFRTLPLDDSREVFADGAIRISSRTVDTVRVPVLIQIKPSIDVRVTRRDRRWRFQPSTDQPWNAALFKLLDFRDVSDSARDCEISSLGYRFVDHEEEGQRSRVLQLAFQSTMAFPASTHCFARIYLQSKGAPYLISWDHSSRAYRLSRTHQIPRKEADYLPLEIQRLAAEDGIHVISIPVDEFDLEQAGMRLSYQRRSEEVFVGQSGNKEHKYVLSRDRAPSYKDDEISGVWESPQTEGAPARIVYAPNTRFIYEGTSTKSFFVIR
ncbi:MAG: S8 family serine peptidase, partial [Pseudobdellovibrionaceae bacterium]|nr:S8 family serine peptidase [Pseudobdellovibrionaceae bacterium]